MAVNKRGRKYDIVVYGATGYTGKLTAEHIAAHLPTNLAWAIAGRSEDKLQSLAAELRTLDPDRQQPTIEPVPTPSSLPGLASETAVLIAAVGPYLLHGEPAFAACAEHGTHYLDVSGETPFLARMVARHGRRAAETGAVMISQIGLESMPADVLTWAVADVLSRGPGGPSARKKVGEGVVGHVGLSMNLNVTPSGGTLATVLTVFEKVPFSELRATHVPFALSPVPNRSPARNPHSLPVYGVRDTPGLGLQTTSVFGAVDKALVERTWGLMQAASATDSTAGPLPGVVRRPYGPGFSFAETSPCRSRVGGAAWHFLLLLGMSVLATSAWVRALVRRFVFEPGQGADREGRARERGAYRAVGEGAGGERRAYASVNFEGGGYTWTGAFIAQGAMVLLEEDVKLPAGVLTPACLGQAYINRLRSVGFDIEAGLLD